MIIGESDDFRPFATFGGPDCFHRVSYDLNRHGQRVIPDTFKISKKVTTNLGVDFTLYNKVRLLTCSRWRTSTGSNWRPRFQLFRPRSSEPR